MAGDTVRVIAVGDIFLGEHPVTLGHGVNSVVKEKGCKFLFSKIKDQLKGGDIVCGNLEGIISPKKNDESGVRSAIYWGEPTCAEALREVGFNCLFLANNHNAQHGKDALERTCVVLEESRIKWTGFNSTNPDSPIPAIFEVGGLRVALLAYCQDQQYNLDTPILPHAEFNNIKRDIYRLKKDADVIIVSLHWGDEFMHYPSPDQIELAHKIIDLGVQLIIGHHSHAVQGVERYKNGLVAYSLGSFIKDLWPRKLRESIILKCEISLAGVKKFDLEPIIIHKRYYLPQIHRGNDMVKFVSRIQTLSKAIENQHIGDTVLMRKKYSKTVKKLLFRDRLGTVMHYILNIFRYDKKMLAENVQLMIERRIKKQNV